jgi:Tfp pilus assembly protein PilN
MIKVNLLPAHILERRRVKTLAVGLLLLLALEVLLLAAYVWAPAPFSIGTQLQRAQDRRATAEAAEAEVYDLEAEVQQVKARYASLGRWVSWVDEADALPEKWIKYFTTLNKYIPANVVINGLSPPSGGALTLSGSTRDMMAAVRWYMNMLRCEMVDPSLGSVQFSPGTAQYTDEPGATAGPMAMPVSIRVVLKPEYLDIFTMPVAPPADVAGGRTARGRGVTAGRGGGGRMGGGGMRGGRGMRGGGPMGRGGRGRGGMGRGPQMGR